MNPAVEAQLQQMQQLFTYYHRLLGQLPPEVCPEACRQSLSSWIMAYVQSVRQVLERAECGAEQQQQLTQALVAAEAIRAAVPWGWNYLNPYYFYLNSFRGHGLNNLIPVEIVVPLNGAEQNVPAAAAPFVPTGNEQWQNRRVMPSLVSPPRAQPDANVYTSRERRRVSRCRAGQCPGCGLLFHSQAALYNHLGEYHRGEKLYVCSICTRRFSRPTNLQNHQRRLHQTIRCEDCGRRYDSPNGYQSHRRARNSPVQCRLCGAAYSTRCALEIHYTSEHPEAATHECPHCEERFLLAVVLRNHLRNVHRHTE